MSNLKWDFYAAVTVNRNVVTTPTLPTDTTNYGNFHIVDNLRPIVQRTFTCDHVDHTKVASLITMAKTRHACCTLTTTITGEYTGRLVSVNLQQVPGTDSYQCTIVLQDRDGELAGTPVAEFVLS